VRVYRSEICFEGDTTVTLKTPSKEDLSELLAFLSKVPESELLIHKDDVLMRDVIESWFEKSDFDQGFKLIALMGEEIVAMGTLHQEGFYLHQASEITLVVDPRWRGKGLGFHIFKVLLTEALKRRLEKIIVRYTPDNENFKRILGHFGFRPEAVFRSHVKDKDTGERKDLVIASYNLGNWLKRFELYNLIYGEQ